MDDRPLAKVERDACLKAILDALEISGSVRAAAVRLKITRRTLYKRLRKYGMYDGGPLKIRRVVADLRRSMCNSL